MWTGYELWDPWAERVTIKGFLFRLLIIVTHGTLCDCCRLDWPGPPEPPAGTGFIVLQFLYVTFNIEIQVNVKAPRSNLYGLICNKKIWIIVFSKKRREKRNPKYIFIITFRTLASQRASPIKTRLDLLLGCLFSGSAPSPLAKVL